MARPTKLTEEKIEIICEALEDGATYSLAAAYAGISDSTWYRWIAKGEECKGDLYQQLWDETRRAVAEHAIRALQKINVSKDPKDHRWMLARRHGYVEGGGSPHQQEQAPKGGTIADHLEYLLRLTTKQREQAAKDKSHVAAAKYLGIERDLFLQIQEARRNEGEDPADLSNEQWAEETAATAAALEMPELEAFVREYIKRTGAKLEPPE